MVERTQAYNYTYFQEPPTQIQTYFIVPTLFKLFGTLTLAAFFGLFSSFSWGRGWLESNPEFFTFNVFTKKGPTRAMIDSTQLRTVLVGKGWQVKPVSDKQNADLEPMGDLNRTVVAQVTGPDPAYRATSTFIVQSALTILADRDRIPE